LEIVGQSDDGAWYQLDDSVWIAASLVEVALSGQGRSSDEATVNLSPQIISRHPSTAVSIAPYDSPVNLGSMVHWYDCASYAPRTEYPLQILNSRTLDVDMLTYYGDGDLSMNLYAEDGTLVSSIYQGPAFEGRKTLTIELPPEITSYMFTSEGRGCWTARLTGND
ncbi:hypothetical protein KC957_00970, partial [Candidatus Saccharibacteria bacterium]|nr:hypothetical protein [Candidatus Saccharibacteria bacterium]